MRRRDDARAQMRTIEAKAVSVEVAAKSGKIAIDQIDKPRPQRTQRTRRVLLLELLMTEPSSKSTSQA